MKKVILSIMAAALSVTFSPSRAAAAKEATAITVITAENADAAKANALLVRLNEIKEMDKTNLTATEKKGLRKEVRDIKQQLSHLNDGVYISAGAVIIILLLLLILL